MFGGVGLLFGRGVGVPNLTVTWPDDLGSAQLNGMGIQYVLISLAIHGYQRAAFGRFHKKGRPAARPFVD